METYGVLKIKQYKYSAFDFQNMNEKWSLLTSNIDFYTYFQFLNHGNAQNPKKLLQNYKVSCKSGNVIEILKAKDESLLRSIETDEEVVSVHSLDPNPKGGFFNLKLEIVEEPAIRVIR